MSEIMLFRNPELGEVRTLTIDEEVWFVGNDIARALEYKDLYSALRHNVSDEDKRVCPVSSTSGVQNTTVINESGLYSLIMSSRLESAKKFKHWVTSEVLPSIRKNGMYATPKTLEEMKNDPQSFIKLLRGYADEMEKNERLQNQIIIQNQQIAEMQPKVTYFDIVYGSKGSVSITLIAKDYGMTANEMNRKLHELGLQYHVNKTWVLYKQYQGYGYTKSCTFQIPNTPYSNTVTQWTAKGRWFIYETLKQNGILPLCEREAV